MARKQETRTIGKTQYRVMMMGGIEGQDILVRLLKILGPVFAGAHAAKSGTAGIRELTHALRELSTSDLTELTEAFAKYTEVQKGKDQWPTLTDIFDDHFAGNYTEMVQWLKFCVEFNFSDFSKLLLDQLSEGEQKKQATESPST